MTNTTFDGLGLVEPLRLALKIERHVQPTPIQARAIPLIAEGKDLLGIAETGLRHLPRRASVEGSGSGETVVVNVISA